MATVTVNQDGEIYINGQRVVFPADGRTNPASILFGLDAVNGRFVPISVTSDGKIDTTAVLQTQSIEIGAVEIKDNDTNNRVDVVGNGDALEPDQYGIYTLGSDGTNSRILSLIPTLTPGQYALVSSDKNIDVLLSTRASETTLSSAVTQLGNIAASLDVNLSTRASESTLSGIKTQTDKLDFDGSNNLNVHITQSDIALGVVKLEDATTTDKVNVALDSSKNAIFVQSESLAKESGGHLASLDAKDFATETTLALIKAKTDNIDVALSTRTKPSDVQNISGTVTANAGTNLNTSALALEAGNLASVKTNTDKLDVNLSTRLSESDFDTRVGEVQVTPTANTILGRLKDIWDRLATTLNVSVQNATLAVTQSGVWKLFDSAGSVINPAKEDGNLATVKTNTDPLVTSGAGGYVRQDSTATIAKESGGNLDTIKTNTNNLDTTLSSRATETTLSNVKTNTDKLDVNLSTRLKPGDFPLPINVADPVTGTQKLAVNASGQAAIQNPPNLDVAASTLATSANQTNGTQKTKIVDSAGTNLASVDAAGHLQVDVTESLPIGSNVIGKVSIDQTTPGTTNKVYSDIEQIAGAAPSATNPLPARITDGTSFLTKQGQTLATSPSTIITDGTNTMPSMDVASRKGFVAVTDGTNVAGVDAANAVYVGGKSATGTAPSSNPVYVAGKDGVGNKQAILTTTTGQTIVVPQDSAGNATPSGDTVGRAPFTKITDGTNVAGVDTANQLYVSGKNAPGVAPASNPIYVSGVDAGNLKRGILTTVTGQTIIVPQDSAGNATPAGDTVGRAPFTKITDGTNVAGVDAQNHIFVAGKSAAGVAPASNPVYTSGIDSGGLKRGIKTTTLGEVVVDSDTHYQTLLGNTYSIPTDLVGSGGGNGVDSVVAYINNPLGSGVNLRVTFLNFGTSTNNRATIFKIWKDPTGAISGGSAFTPINLNIGSANTSVATSSRVSTTASKITFATSLGTMVNNFVFAQNTTCFSGINLINEVIVQPNHSIILTAQGVGGAVDIVAEVDWHEVA